MGEIVIINGISIGVIAIANIMISSSINDTVVIKISNSIVDINIINTKMRKRSTVETTAVEVTA